MLQMTFNKKDKTLTLTHAFKGHLPQTSISGGVNLSMYDRLVFSRIFFIDSSSGKIQ